ncbi:MAG: RNA polymerase sigma factor [bacterium]|nr:RNA polymerase sigma factor [bacterium]
MPENPWNGNAEALLAHAGWVRELARGLVLDRSRSDDVVQDVWVEALEQPPAHTANLRAWFARVVRNRARQHGRRESRGRRRDVEASVADGASPTDDLVAQAELQRAVVVELGEPYRTVILQRYWSGLGSPEIARLHGVAESTVRGPVPVPVAGWVLWLGLEPNERRRGPAPPPRPWIPARFGARPIQSPSPKRGGRTPSPAHRSRARGYERAPRPSCTGCRSP